MRIRTWIICFLVLGLAVTPLAPARAYQATTLRSGMRGDAVKEMQTALIKLGYLGGTADGVFGTHTENAVRKFQKANRLTADGLAGLKTLEVLYKKANMTSSSSSSSSTTASSSSSSSSASSNSSSTSSSSSGNSASASSSSSLFGGNYSTLRTGDTGSRVKTLQQQLISMGYLKGSADGKFGALTRSAVIAYQKANKLTADGLAGKLTLTSIEKKASSSASSSSSSTTSSSSSSSSSSSGSASSSTTASGPSGSKVKLLHWFNDIKPTLKNGQTLLIYEPSSGQSWNLRIYSCGRHCDAEPLTAEDTASMLKAFGNQNTWSQKAVYVKLPSGTWTIGSTHDMPHLSGSISNNNFNGHLCVHFLRDMSEAKKNDPSYGVSNQNTIRAFWKSLTGETITY